MELYQGDEAWSSLREVKSTTKYCHANALKYRKPLLGYYSGTNWTLLGHYLGTSWALLGDDFGDNLGNTFDHLETIGRMNLCPVPVGSRWQFLVKWTERRQRRRKSTVN